MTAGRFSWAAAAAYGYVAAVLVADTLASQGVNFGFEWRVLRVSWHGADLFKFAAWFVVPMIVCAPFLDMGYLTFARWKRVDWIILAGVVGVGAIVVALLPLIPGVNEYYRGWGGRPFDQRVDRALSQVLWTFSWLTGWEFMHRYLLPYVTLRAWPKRGGAIALVAIPAIEAIYHIIQDKPPLECLGVAAMSLVFTAWVLRRRNALLPFLGHLAIELQLIAYLFFAD